ncbi:MAG: 3-hydroxyacyl-CoA dehydrogenase [Rhodospirillaceae bacterium]|nr:3-hydroxyacyl-CoA dehydrogenase [Rhodospirillaceae bacterium]
MEISEQAAIVTGGGSGLGAATAKALAAAGARVAILDVNLTNAESIADEVKGIAIECDVSDATSGERAISLAREKHGESRILINCAGIGPAEKIVGKTGPMPLNNFKRVIDVNLVGSFNIMRLAASDMIQLTPLKHQERGVIISTASVAAFEGQLGQAAYSASKGGIHALTIVGAREFARHGIRVNTIAPGLFATPLLLGMPENVQESLAASVPYPSRFGTPEEYAKLVLSIIDNVMINGETIRLDGAIRMQPR